MGPRAGLILCILVNLLIVVTNYLRGGELRTNTEENPLRAVIVESLLLRELLFMYTMGSTQEHIGRTF